MGAQTSPRDRLVLGLILLLALALRLYRLDAPLWYDEIITLEGHLRLPWGAFLSGYDLNFHYLHNALAKLSISLFGESPWALRLPAMLFGLGGIWAMWVLARDVAGARIAHLVALLLALSYHHIWFSQNARGYTGLAFFGTLGMILWLRAMAAPALRLWLGYGVVLALAVFTHLTGAFLFAAQGLIWLALVIADALRGRLGRPRLLPPLAGYALGGALTLALHAPMLGDLLASVGGVGGTSAVDVMQEYQNPLWSLLEGFRTALGNLGALLALAAAAVLALALIGGIASARRAPLFAPAVALHVALTLALLLALGMRIWPRFFFADIGFVLLLIVLGVRAASTWAARALGLDRRLAFRAAALAMVLLSLPLAARNYMAPKQDLAGAFAHVEQIRRPGERVYAVGFPAAVFREHFGADWQPILDDDDWRAARARPGPLIVVVAFPARGLRKVAALDAETETALRLERRFAGTLGDGAVLVFRRD